MPSGPVWDQENLLGSGRSGTWHTTALRTVAVRLRVFWDRSVFHEVRSDRLPPAGGSLKRQKPTTQTRFNSFVCVGFLERSELRRGVSIRRLRDISFSVVHTRDFGEA